MLRRLYNWTMRLAEHRHARLALFAISFIEASVFPVPPDVVLIPMVLRRRNRAFLLAALCTLASVTGAFLGYGIGYFLFEQVGRPLLEFYGATEAFDRFRALYDEWGVWIVAMTGVTFFPFKVVTIASGVFKLDFAEFAVAALVARTIRFYLVAGLLWWAGPKVEYFVERNLGLTATLAAGFVFAVLLLAHALVAG